MEIEELQQSYKEAQQDLVEARGSVSVNICMYIYIYIYIYIYMLYIYIDR